MDRVSTRPLTSVPAADLATLLPALSAALDGTGPAVLPLPRSPEAVLAAVRDALRPDDPSSPLEHDDVAIVMPTSGSTGRPKGVLLTAAALEASGRATYARLAGPGAWLLALDPGHVAGLQVVLRSLLADTPLTVLDLTDGFRAEAFAAAAERLPSGLPTYTSLVPTQLTRVLDAGGAALDALCGFDTVLVGGASIPEPLLRRGREAGARLVTTYGMSETCGGCVYDGWPLDGVRLDLVDGRIVLGGPVVAAGYRLDPELTATHFRADTYLTQDAGRLEADGRLTVLGRIDDIVVSGGENVPLAAVEEAALHVPGVREAAAFGRPDPEWGTRVELAVVPRDAAVVPGLADVRAVVAARAGRAAAPRRLHVLAALPLLASGKVDRERLRGSCA